MLMPALPEVGRLKNADFIGRQPGFQRYSAVLIGPEMLQKELPRSLFCRISGIQAAPCGVAASIPAAGPKVRQRASGYFLVQFSHQHTQVGKSVRIPCLVVVPSKYLYQIVFNKGHFGIVNARVRIAYNINRNNRVFGVFQNSL